MKLGCIETNDGQPFARKLIRPFGFVTDEDLQNELNAINRICTQNHRNIVNILRHDHVQNSPFYYIDMQFCDINLDDYIYKPWPESLSGTSKFCHGRRDETRRG